MDRICHFYPLAEGEAVKEWGHGEDQVVAMVINPETLEAGLRDGGMAFPEGEMQMWVCGSWTGLICRQPAYP